MGQDNCETTKNEYAEDLVSDGGMISPPLEICSPKLRPIEGEGGIIRSAVGSCGFTIIILYVR